MTTMVRMSADGADFRETVDFHALASHRDQLAIDADAEIVSQLVRARSERTRLRLLHEFQHFVDRYSVNTRSCQCPSLPAAGDLAQWAGGAAFVSLLLGREPEPRLQQELHLGGGGAPQGPTRLLVLSLDLLPELGQGRVLLLLGGPL